MDNCSGFENFKVGVAIGNEVKSEFSVQVMSLVTLNILARWCRDVTVQMPDQVVSQLPSAKNSNLQEYFAKMMHQADPFGEFVFEEIEQDKIDVLATLGSPKDSYGKDVVHVGGAGWVGGIDVGGIQIPFREVNESRNVIGPAFASCLGSAEIFRRAVGLGGSHSLSSWYSLYDFQSAEDPRNLANPEYNSRPQLGRIYQIGCGAVGSSLDLLMSLTEWSAGIELIDFDRVEPSNCNRGLSFQAHDCVSDRYKADACATVLSNGNFQLHAFNDTYARFIEQGNYLKKSPDVVLCLANEQNVWATIQNNFPPLVMHATTTPSWGTNFGRHIPKADWCLMCRFEQELDHQFVPNCGEGQLVLASGEGPSVEGVLPFLPTAAAVILLSELAKLSLSQYPVNSNFVTFSLRRPEGRFVQLRQEPGENCVCREQSLDLYPLQIKATKYWNLS
jgi:hypothetical protein